MLANVREAELESLRELHPPAGVAVLVRDEDSVVVDEVGRDVQREEPAELPHHAGVPVHTDVLRILQDSLRTGADASSPRNCH